MNAFVLYYMYWSNKYYWTGSIWTKNIEKAKLFPTADLAKREELKIVSSINYYIEIIDLAEIHKLKLGENTL